MGNIFGKTLTPQEQMRQYKREVDRAIRELDKERKKLEVSNDKLVVELKKAAKADNKAVVKIMAKDYVRVKRSVTKFYQLRTYLQGVGLQLQTMKSIDAMSTAMKNTTKAMVKMNQKVRGVLKTSPPRRYLASRWSAQP
jgi:charged multivesicular body protein 2A